MQVFSVQRANKKFSARHNCQARTYEYYLPADVIGLDGGSGDEEKIRSGKH